MRRAALAAVVATSLAAGLAACSDSNGPGDGDIQGTYSLATVNGAPLPFIVHRSLLAPTRVLVGGSLAVQSRGRLQDVRTFHLGAVTANAPQEADTASYAYTQNRNLLLVTRPRFNPAQSHVDSGEVRGDEVTLYVHYIWANDIGPQRATLLYRRVR